MKVSRLTKSIYDLRKNIYNKKMLSCGIKMCMYSRRHERFFAEETLVMIEEEWDAVSWPLVGGHQKERKKNWDNSVPIGKKMVWWDLGLTKNCNTRRRMSGWTDEKEKNPVLWTLTENGQKQAYKKNIQVLQTNKDRKKWFEDVKVDLVKVRVTEDDIVNRYWFRQIMNFGISKTQKRHMQRRKKKEKRENKRNWENEETLKEN